jgi:hypothetical protein
MPEFAKEFSGQIRAYLGLAEKVRGQQEKDN